MTSQLMLLTTSGFALFALRDTSWMGIALLSHLAIALAFVLLLPYGKLVHGLYHYLALRHARRERGDVRRVERSAARAAAAAR
jgi:citrate/tricarballylate utilization protein